MISALRSIQRTDASRLMLVPRLCAGLPLLVAGAAHYVRPSLLQHTLAQAGAPLCELLAQALPCMAIVAGISLLLGYFGRVGAFLAIEVSLISVSTLCKLYELPAIDANTASWLPPLSIPLLVTFGALAVLLLGSGRASVDYGDTRTTFEDDEDQFTEFDFLDDELVSEDSYPATSFIPHALGV